MELNKISIGRLTVTLAKLNGGQVSRSFGFAAEARISVPVPPGGSTQEEAVEGSEEFKAEYNQYLFEQNRIELLGLISVAHDPDYFFLMEGDKAADEISKETQEIEATAKRMGWTQDPRYPDSVTFGHQVVFIIEKNRKLIPEAFVAISKFSDDCMKAVGYVGGEAIEAEIKSAEANDERAEPTPISEPRAEPEEDPVCAA